MIHNDQRWPECKTAAVSITLDNMGEAAEIGRGTWSGDLPVGEHVSVTRALPPVLGLLEELGVHVTYFIEGWNATVYGGVIQRVAGAGHEIALHGWQHEPWWSLESSIEMELLDRSLDAFSDIGIRPVGFRPPGGRLTESTRRLLEERGFTHISPAGLRAAVWGSLAILPFDWQGIDAYYYSPPFGVLREIKGDSPDTLTPADLEGGFHRILNRCLETSGYTALLFHPFLETDKERFDVMRRLIQDVTHDERIWCAPCRDVADWVLSNSELFEEDPELDESTWTR